jgi:hypothetical protein
MPGIATSQKRVSPLSIQLDARAAPPISLLVPELDASNSASVTRQIDGARSAAGANSLSNVYIMVAAVLEVYDHAIEFNGAIPDLKQNRPKRPAVIHRDPVVIRPSVYVRLSEVLPSAAAIAITIAISISLWGCCESTIKNKQQRA